MLDGRPPQWALAWNNQLFWVIIINLFYYFIGIIMTLSFRWPSRLRTWATCSEETISTKWSLCRTIFKWAKWRIPFEGQVLFMCVQYNFTSECLVGDKRRCTFTDLCSGSSCGENQVGILRCNRASGIQSRFGRSLQLRLLNCLLPFKISVSLCSFYASSKKVSWYRRRGG